MQDRSGEQKRSCCVASGRSGGSYIYRSGTPWRCPDNSWRTTCAVTIDTGTCTRNFSIVFYPSCSDDCSYGISMYSGHFGNWSSQKSARVSVLLDSKSIGHSISMMLSAQFVHIFGKLRNKTNRIQSAFLIDDLYLSLFRTCYDLIVRSF